MSPQGAVRYGVWRGDMDAKVCVVFTRNSIVVAVFTFPRDTVNFISLFVVEQWGN